MGAGAVLFGWHWYQSSQKVAPSQLWVFGGLASRRYTFGHYELAWDSARSQWELTSKNNLLWQSIPTQAFIQAAIKRNHQLIDCLHQSIQQVFTQAGVLQFSGQVVCGKQLIPYQMEWREITSNVLKLKLVILSNEVQHLYWLLNNNEQMPSQQLSSEGIKPWQGKPGNMENSCRLPGIGLDNCQPERVGGFYWEPSLTLWRLQPTT